MISSTISRGSPAAGDELVVEACGGGLTDHILRAMAGVRYQICLTSSSITTAAIVVKRCDEGRLV
jgi:hypothetical protein